MIYELPIETAEIYNIGVRACTLCAATSECSPQVTNSTDGADAIFFSRSCPDLVQHHPRRWVCARGTDGEARADMPRPSLSLGDGCG